MEEDTESLFYLGLGPLAAILLGMALVPVRGFTTASNFAFAFMALTIVVAEFGGRWAAVATALSSALSLDFFLTQPYLRLVIHEKHDIMAFIGLGVCGLIAASLGSERGEKIARLMTARRHRDLIHAVLSEWDGAAQVGPQLTEILRLSCNVFPVAALSIRNDQGDPVASSELDGGTRPVPDVVLEPGTLLPTASTGKEVRRRSLALPSNGGRIALVVGTCRLGWLDVWGNGATAGTESRRALSDIARLLAVLLAQATSGVLSQER